MKKTKIIIRDEKSDNTALFCNGNGSSVLIQFRYALGIPYEYKDDSYSYFGYVPGLFKDVDGFNEAMSYIEWLCQREKGAMVVHEEYERMLYEEMRDSRY